MVRLSWLAQVVEASMLLLEDARAFGKVVLVHINGRLYEWAPPPKGNLRELRPEAAPTGGGHASAEVDDHVTDHVLEVQCLSCLAAHERGSENTNLQP